MNKQFVILLASLMAASCGEAVAPSSRPVSFRTVKADGTVVELASIAVRAESSDGQVLEALTASDGTATVLLATNTRWDVTFAGSNVYPVSILGLRADATTSTVAVQMSTRGSELRRTPPGPSGPRCIVPSNAELHQLRVRVRNYVRAEMRAPRSEVGPFACLWGVERVPNSTDTFDYVFQVASFPNAPPIEFWIGETSFPTGGASPWPERGVFRRVDPRPAADTTVEIDYAGAEPSPPSSTINIQLPSTGIVTTQSVAHTTIEVPDGLVFAEYGDNYMHEAGVNIGFSILRFPASALQPQIEPRVSHSEWISSNTPPRSAYAGHRLSVNRPSGLSTSLTLLVNPLIDHAVVIPESTELDATGTRIDNVQFRVQGAFTQGGFFVSTQATAVAVSQRVWTGWLFDAPSSQITAQFRIPRLPTGYSLAGIAGADRFHAEAFMSTLPRELPGYSYYPLSAATAIVTASSTALTAGDR